jgi:hypothetical protein
VTVDREVLPWELFGSAADELAAGVAADGFAPDLILAVARGGLFVAGALGYALSVKNVAVMNVEFYTGVDQRLDVPVVLPPVPNTVDLSGARTAVPGGFRAKRHSGLIDVDEKAASTIIATHRRTAHKRAVPLAFS